MIITMSTSFRLGDWADDEFDTVDPLASYEDTLKAETLNCSNEEEEK